MPTLGGRDFPEDAWNATINAARSEGIEPAYMLGLLHPESSARCDAVNDGSGTHTDEYSVGLFQINVKAHPQFTIQSLKDCAFNAAVAARLINASGGVPVGILQHWVLNGPQAIAFGAAHPLGNGSNNGGNDPITGAPPGCTIDPMSGAMICQPGGSKPPGIYVPGGTDPIVPTGPSQIPHDCGPGFTQIGPFPVGPWYVGPLCLDFRPAEILAVKVLMTAVAAIVVLIILQQYTQGLNWGGSKGTLQVPTGE